MNRKQFLRAAGLGAVALAVIPLVEAAGLGRAKKRCKDCNNFNLGVSKTALDKIRKEDFHKFYQKTTNSGYVWSEEEKKEFWEARKKINICNPSLPDLGLWCQKMTRDPEGEGCSNWKPRVLKDTRYFLKDARCPKCKRVVKGRFFESWQVPLSRCNHCYGRWIQKQKERFSD